MAMPPTICRRANVWPARIEDFCDRRDHAAYVAHLRTLHGRKTAFWNAAS